jgi:hypothetical protein
MRSREGSRIGNFRRSRTVGIEIDVRRGTALEKVVGNCGAQHFPRETDRIVSGIPKKMG